MSKKTNVQNLLLGVILSTCLAFFIGILVNATYEGLRENFSINQIFWPFLLLTYLSIFWLIFLIENFDDLYRKNINWNKLFALYFWSNHKTFLWLLSLILAAWFCWIGLLYSFTAIWDYLFTKFS